MGGWKHEMDIIPQTKEVSFQKLLWGRFMAIDQKKR
jgi:hypothetical protein